MAQGIAQLRGMVPAQTQNGAQPMNGAGASITEAYISSASEVVLDSTAHTQTYAECQLQDLLFQHCYSLGQGFWCWEWGEHILKGNGASMDLTLRASAAATCDLISTPMELATDQRNPSSTWPWL